MQKKEAIKSPLPSTENAYTSTPSGLAKAYL
jgi:hypothetical protein